MLYVSYSLKENFFFFSFKAFVLRPKNKFYILLVGQIQFFFFFLMNKSNKQIQIHFFVVLLKYQSEDRRDIVHLKIKKEYSSLYAVTYVYTILYKYGKVIKSDF